MNSTNLTLWSAVEKTPVEQTKPITGKSYSGNSPKPHHIVKRATETFGPCGIGWGFKIIDERIVDTATYADGTSERMHYAKVQVWYMWGGQRGEVEHVGGTILSGRRKAGDGPPFTDDDAPKKSVTDALIKALSLIGFAGDIFLGRYDDSKYMAELREEAKADKQSGPAPQSRQEPRQPPKAPARASAPANGAARSSDAPTAGKGPVDWEQGDDIAFGKPVDVDYVNTVGAIETVPIEIGIRKLRAAHKAPEDKLSNADWFTLYENNKAWLTQHAPGVADELATRG